ncbi:glycine cleavage system protein T [Amylibacter ulvae]|uniref:Glycine cleavage system protein T n=1 Tax=Paramylibacter ulvae TaxID=1651968 RepID=A0ABQ3CVD0_9RHOB|nr:dimethylsulfoniopropionate demethylase [Amylibacter ulvae]GHA44602.1 glycine cleavage system protein T [Amylibacter ulvae]
MTGAPIFPTRRLRTTPFMDRVVENGVSAFTIYNHMFLPVVYNSLEEDAAHLKQYAQIWDVSAERQVQLHGPDARKLSVMMSARDLTNAQPGRCYYAPITNKDGKFINDPVALCLADDLFWFSVADSDLIHWAAGLAAGLGLDVQVSEPDVSPLAIQGPMAEDLMVDVFGDAIRDIKFFRFATFEFMGRQLNIARSGWSKQGGFEIYLDDSSLGNDLWDTIWAKGAPYNLRAGCPNLIERVEGGLLSLGTDMTSDDTPLNAGLEKFISLESGHDFIGKDALLAQRDAGGYARLKGLKISGDAALPVSNSVDCFINGEKVGFITTAVYSPDFKCNLAFAMLDVAAQENGTTVLVTLDNVQREAVVCDLPFLRE